MKRAHNSSSSDIKPKAKKTKYELENKALEDAFLKHPSQDIKEFFESQDRLQWRIRVTTEEPFSLGQVNNCTLALSFCSLQINDNFSIALPTKVKEIEDAKKKLKSIMAHEDEET